MVILKFAFKLLTEISNTQYRINEKLIRYRNRSLLLPILFRSTRLQIFLQLFFIDLLLNFFANGKAFLRFHLIFSALFQLFFKTGMSNKPY